MHMGGSQKSTLGVSKTFLYLHSRVNLQLNPELTDSSLDSQLDPGILCLGLLSTEIG